MNAYSLSQKMLNMTEGVLKMVADHMGHSLDIHTNIYKMQSSVIEKSKVARVLENGMVNRWKGKRLDDINIAGMII